MRTGDRAMSTAEVVAGMIEELGYGADAGSGLSNRVRANLRHLEVRGTVLKDGKGPRATWSINNR